MSEELPGMLALAKAVAEQKWPHTMNAQVWAREFNKTFAELHEGCELDEGWLIGWFANAIMAGYDTAQARLASVSQNGVPECLVANANNALSAPSMEHRLSKTEEPALRPGECILSETQAWIPVSERRPPAGQWVLVVDADGECRTAYFFGDTFAGPIVEPVKFWTPLPEAPHAAKR